MIVDINEVISYGPYKASVLTKTPSVQPVPVPVPAPSPAKKMNTFAVTQVLNNVALSEAQGAKFQVIYIYICT
jgi:hypothetical protein